MVVGIHQLHLARLHLGQIQDVVDDGQQVFGGGLHVLGVLMDGGIGTLLHNDVVQPDDGVHGGAYLVGHIGQELAFGDVGLFRLPPDPFDLVDVRLDVRHVQHQNDTALLLAVFVQNLLAVALVVLSVDGKAPGDALVQHLLPEVLHHPDVLPQLVLGQAGEYVGRRPVVAHQAVVVVQGDDPVSQALQHLFRRQMAEVVVPAAPHHNDHHSHGQGQRHRRQVEHVEQLQHVGRQHNDGQGGYAQDGRVLAADLPVGPQADGPHQRKDTQGVGDDDPGEQEHEIQRAIAEIDMIKSSHAGHPPDVPVEQSVPVADD